MSKEFRRLDTRLVHAGEPRPLVSGAVTLPIFQSSTYEHTGRGGYHDIKYIRLNNTPNHAALHEKLADLEEGEAAIVTGSGMAAIATLFLAFLKPGDRVLAQDCLYGGTHDLILNDLAPLGIHFDFIEADRPETWAEKITPETRMVYVEAISNPLMQVIDFDAVLRLARDHHLLSVIDNTFATPVNFRPLTLGFDLTLHSCTKYLNGHSDIVAGAVIGGRENIETVCHKLNHLGGTLDPHACFLLHRGLKTLGLRVRRQNENALRLAEALARHPAVETVHYPGLASHPGHAEARRFFDGYGGMLSFEVSGGVTAADELIRRLVLPICAPSLGGVESLITRPATTSHAGMSPQDREAAGISDHLIRVSVGIEALEDLVADFEQALNAL